MPSVTSGFICLLPKYLSYNMDHVNNVNEQQENKLEKAKTTDSNELEDVKQEMAKTKKAIGRYQESSSWVHPMNQLLILAEREQF